MITPLARAKAIIFLTFLLQIQPIDVVQIVAFDEIQEIIAIVVEDVLWIMRIQADDDFAADLPYHIPEGIVGIRIVPFPGVRCLVASPHIDFQGDVEGLRAFGDLISHRFRFFVPFAIPIHVEIGVGDIGEQTALHAGDDVIGIAVDGLNLVGIPRRRIPMKVIVFAANPAMLAKDQIIQAVVKQPPIIVLVFLAEPLRFETQMDLDEVFVFLLQVADGRKIVV